MAPLLPAKVTNTASSGPARHLSEVRYETVSVGSGSRQSDIAEIAPSRIVLILSGGMLWFASTASPNDNLDTQLSQVLAQAGFTGRAEAGHSQLPAFLVMVEPLGQVDHAWHGWTPIRSVTASLASDR